MGVAYVTTFSAPRFAFVSTKANSRTGALTDIATVSSCERPSWPPISPFSKKARLNYFLHLPYKRLIRTTF